jgi:hypothetical protein
MPHDAMRALKNDEEDEMPGLAAPSDGEEDDDDGGGRASRRGRRRRARSTRARAAMRVQRL